MKQDSRIWTALALIAALAIPATGRANETSADPTPPAAQDHHGMMNEMSSMMGMMDAYERMMSDGARGAPNEQWRPHRQPRPGTPLR